MSKKLILALCAMVVVGSSAFAELALRVGTDLEGQYRTKAEGASWNSDPDMYTDVRAGFTLGAEYMVALAPVVKAGAGAEFRVHRSLQDSLAERTIAFLPLYGLVRMPLNVEGLRIVPTGRIGYGVLMGNEAYTGSNTELSGGLYWAAGLGFQLSRNLFVEGLYSVNEGMRTTTAQILGTTTTTRSSVRYSTVEISIGYAFGR